MSDLPPIDLRLTVFQCARCEWQSEPSRETRPIYEELCVHIDSVHGRITVPGTWHIAHTLFVEPEPVPTPEQPGLFVPSSEEGAER